MDVRFREEKIADDGEGSDQSRKQRSDTQVSFSRDFHQQQGIRRSRPIAIPRTESLENPEARAIRPEAMSLPATLHAPLLGASLPTSRPPPFQLSDTTDHPPLNDISIPYGSLRDHRRHERLGTSIPNPRPSDTGLTVADRIRGARKPAKSSQISSLSRMMQEAVTISSHGPKSPIIDRRTEQQLPPFEQNLSTSLTGLQILKSRAIPSPVRSTSLRSTEIEDSIDDGGLHEQEEGAFPLDLE